MKFLIQNNGGAEESLKGIPIYVTRQGEYKILENTIE